MKNLAVATALTKITGGKAVAMLGASLGVHDGALEAYKAWNKLAQYEPTIYFDTELPIPSQVLTDGSGDKIGTKLFNGVVIYKSDGKPTYAAHDLSFVDLVHPTHYLTGAEQKQHFANLGLGEKHISLGLVLEANGGKMKSKIKDKVTGEQTNNPNAVSAEQLFHEVLGAFNETAEPTKLAWNVIAWQFNSSAVASDTKYNPIQWTKAESPGLYITYTYAKIASALSKAQSHGDSSQLSDEDVKLIGFANYFDYYLGKAQSELEPHFLAQFAMKLAQKLASVYGKHQIVGGSNGLIYAITYANDKLQQSMELLSMYPLKSV